MTTTNNHLTLIEKVGGIEKAKAIVDGAPEGATIISLATLEYFRELVNPLYENEPYRFLRIQITEDGLLRHSTRFAPIISPINLNDLRTAIAQYDKIWMEKRFSIKKWHPIPEHHMCTDKQSDQEFKVGDKIIFSAMGNSVMEYQDCLKMFLSQGLIRHATPAEIAAGHRLDKKIESDHVTDIHNHISPNMKVIDHG